METCTQERIDSFVKSACDSILSGDTVTIVDTSYSSTDMIGFASDAQMAAIESVIGAIAAADPATLDQHSAELHKIIVDITITWAADNASGFIERIDDDARAEAEISSYLSVEGWS